MAAHELGEAWSDELSQPHREALYSAFVELVDNYFTAEDREDNLIADGMPTKYRHRYTELFLRRFLTTFLTVGYKLVLREPPAPLLSCTAEELSCAIIIGFAEVHLEEKGIKADSAGSKRKSTRTLTSSSCTARRWTALKTPPSSRTWD
jgi:hypothetical protein